MLYREIIAVCSEIQTQHIQADVLNVNPRVATQKISLFKELSYFVHEPGRSADEYNPTQLTCVEVFSVYDLGG